NDVVTEILTGQGSGSPAVPLIVPIDALNGCKNLVHGGEPQKAPSRGQYVAEPGLLRDYRPAGGQVLGTAFTKPTAPQPHILVFGNGKLTTRAPNVMAIQVQVPGKSESMPHFPAIALQQHSVFFFITA